MVINEDKLKVLLAKQNLTKSDLCEKLGISSRTIAKISKGEDINTNVVNKIVTFLGISYENLLDRNNILQTLRNEKMFGIKGMLYHENPSKTDI